MVLGYAGKVRICLGNFDKGLCFSLRMHCSMLGCLDVVEGVLYKRVPSALLLGVGFLSCRFSCINVPQRRMLARGEFAGGVEGNKLRPCGAGLLLSEVGGGRPVTVAEVTTGRVSPGLMCLVVDEMLECGASEGNRKGQMRHCYVKLQGCVQRLPSLRGSFRPKQGGLLRLFVSFIFYFFIFFLDRLHWDWTRRDCPMPDLDKKLNGES